MKWTTRRPTNPNRAGRLIRAWQLIITDDTWVKIVAHTNKRITEFCSNIQDVLDNKDKLSQYKLTSLVEMKAWLGILYRRGALKLNGTDINTVLSHVCSNDIFG